jgi:hypothetical protein
MQVTGPSQVMVPNYLNAQQHMPDNSTTKLALNILFSAIHRPCNNKQYDDCEQRVKTAAKQATVTMIPAPLWPNYTKL